jgi:ligand-binding sensor domain-containing protein
VVWYRTDNSRLAQLRGTNLLRLDNPFGLRSPRVNALGKDASGLIYVGTEKEIAAWDGKKFLDLTPTNGEPNVAVRQMVSGAAGAFWVLTENKLRKCVNWQWVAEVATGASNLWSSVDGLALFADTQGGVWATHRREGLWHVDREGHVSRVSEKQGLPNGLVGCWFEDHEGNFWAGLSDGGLVCVRPRVFHTVWPAEGLQNKSARSIGEDAEGVMWFGTAGQPIVRWQDGEFKIYSPPPQPQAGVETTVLPAGPGRLWVGTVQNGLWLLDHGDFKRPFASETIGTVVRCLHQDRAGALWIGSEFGLFRWAGGTLKRFTSADGFSAAYVLSLAEDTAGAIWIGTAVGELRRYQDGKFQTFRPTDALGGTNVLHAEEDIDPMLARSASGTTLIRSARRI